MYGFSDLVFACYYKHLKLFCCYLKQMFANYVHLMSHRESVHMQNTLMHTAVLIFSFINY